MPQFRLRCGVLTSDQGPNIMHQFFDDDQHHNQAGNRKEHLKRINWNWHTRRRVLVQFDGKHGCLVSFPYQNSQEQKGKNNRDYVADCFLPRGEIRIEEVKFDERIVIQ